MDGTGAMWLGDDAGAGTKGRQSSALSYAGGCENTVLWAGEGKFGKKPPTFPQFHSHDDDLNKQIIKDQN